jgi:hypothetical protein
MTTRASLMCCPECNGDSSPFIASKTVELEPEPGALSVCLQCGSALQIGDDGRLRVLNEGERALLERDIRTKLDLLQSCVQPELKG